VHCRENVVNPTLTLTCHIELNRNWRAHRLQNSSKLAVFHLGTGFVMRGLRLGSVNRWTGPPHWAR